MDDIQAKRYARDWFIFIIIGLAAGILSGFFGIGGGTIIVPALVLFAKFGQRLAAGTSLAAILPPAVAGIFGYFPSGNVDWLAALLIACGSVVGAQFGSWLLQKLSSSVLRWLFIGFLVVVAAEMFLTVPNRGASLEIDFAIAAALVGLGFVTGVLAGLVGVGGGIVVVPALTMLFGVSDLVAKGTSLLMMLPTSISGTIGSVRRKNVDLTAAAIIGLTAACSSFIGVWLAFFTPAQVANILFGVYVLFLIIRMIFHALKQKGN